MNNVYEAVRGATGGMIRKFNQEIHKILESALKENGLIWEDLTITRQRIQDDNMVAFIAYYHGEIILRWNEPVVIEDSLTNTYTYQFTIYRT